jgi:hypothetical protein
MNQLDGSRRNAQDTSEKILQQYLVHERSSCLPYRLTANARAHDHGDGAAAAAPLVAFFRTFHPTAPCRCEPTQYLHLVVISLVGAAVAARRISSDGTILGVDPSPRATATTAPPPTLSGLRRPRTSQRPPRRRSEAARSSCVPPLAKYPSAHHGPVVVVVVVLSIDTIHQSSAGVVHRRQ